MSRQPRNQNQTSYYHILIQGNNQHNIFLSDNEKKMMKLITIDKLYDKPNIKLHAYCIMDNHLHFLLYCPENTLSLFMQKITTAYARYYNDEHNQRGQVFFNRFKSETIDRETKYCQVMRYINNHPILTKPLPEFVPYKWSSLKGLLLGDDDILSNESFLTYQRHFPNSNAYLNYHKQIDNKVYLDTSDDKFLKTQEVVLNILSSNLKKTKSSDLSDLYNSPSNFISFIKEVKSTITIGPNELALILKINSDIIKSAMKHIYHKK